MDEPPGSQPATSDGGELKAEPIGELSGEFWAQLGPLLPPHEGCEPVAEDGGVLKKVLVEGYGDKPSKYARCLGRWPQHMLMQFQDGEWGLCACCISFCIACPETRQDMQLQHTCPVCIH